MEIGKHGIRYEEAVAGQDKDIGPAGELPHLACGAGTGSLLDEADGGRADADDTAAFLLGAGDGLSYLSRNDAILAVDDVVAGVFLGDGSEGVQPDVESVIETLDAAGGDITEEFRGEMEPGGGGGGAAGLAGIDGLVAFGVGEFLMDIGGQGHLAGGEERLLVIEPDGTDAFVTGSQDFRADAGRDIHGSARLESFRRFDEGFPGTGFQPPEQQDFHPAAAGLVAVQAGGNHPGVVEHQQVPGGEQLDEVRETAVGEPPSISSSSSGTSPWSTPAPLPYS